MLSISDLVPQPRAGADPRPKAELYSNIRWYRVFFGDATTSITIGPEKNKDHGLQQLLGRTVGGDSGHGGSVHFTAPGFVTGPAAASNRIRIGACGFSSSLGSTKAASIQPK